MINFVILVRLLLCLIFYFFAVPCVTLEQPAQGNVEVEASAGDNINSNKYKLEVGTDGNDNTQTLTSVQVHIHNNITTNANTVLEPLAPSTEKERPDFQADVEVYVPTETSVVLPANINDIINGRFCILELLTDFKIVDDVCIILMQKFPVF